MTRRGTIENWNTTMTDRTEIIETDITTALLMPPRIWEDSLDPHNPAIVRFIRHIVASAADALEEAGSARGVLRIPATPEERDLYEDLITDEDRMFSDAHGDDEVAS
jgi:hypothetical protein